MPLSWVLVVVIHPFYCLCPGDQALRRLLSSRSGLTDDDVGCGLPRFLKMALARQAARPRGDPQRDGAIDLDPHSRLE